MRGGGCGRSSSRARIRCGATCFSTSWRRAWRLPIEIVLADVFKSEAIPEHERLDPAAVVADLNANGKPARLLPDADAIVEAISPELQPGDVVAILSNGGFGGIYEKLPAKTEISPRGHDHRVNASQPVLRSCSASLRCSFQPSMLVAATPVTCASPARSRSRSRPSTSSRWPMRPGIWRT